jgi:hypothetical protein
MLFAKSPLKESWLGVGELYFVRAACVRVSWADFFALASVCKKYIRNHISDNYDQYSFEHCL